MIERDENLRKVLGQWEVPQARPVLDSRVWHSWHEEQQRRRRWKIFGAVAAAVILVVSIAKRPATPSPDDNADWRPLPDGAITVKVR
jgi:hypothetical protein